MRSYFAIVLPVVFTFLGALFVNEYLKKSRVSSRETEKPQEYIKLNDQDPYFDIGEIEIGYTLTLKNYAQFSTYDDIELLFKFFDSRNELVDQKKETLSGPIRPGADRTYRIQLSLKEALRKSGHVQIVGARSI
ncbi:hypothetical protein [Flavilitoribacter nigricans]|uniref:Uncharacterized protein n=1 Tax=Flavilitoribacter nigricans (strain ATCC 23147 / DSM 23189 / NBRC 102662 / NCIMB 1420 / SS-2) TaxID=1122177 RepID=A0A2D0NCB2_FLAN2|nr:hypothetical protein [Flavilitoribacter nigricans]PHN06141.1 hypothetical protein CRP01_11190 [Flavilitoribacter nigricans DSM 23189 = NBRC 102662]